MLRWLAAAFLIVAAVAGSADGRPAARDSAAGAWPCSWPTLGQDKFPTETVNVQTIQELLNFRMESGLWPNGDFNGATTRSVENFQLSVGLQPDGKVGPDTWRALVLPIPGERGVNARGGPVRAVQQQLIYWGFLPASFAVTGVWLDNATVPAVLAFQQSRGLAAASPDSEAVVDTATWLLLVSGCNASLSAQTFGVDVGWPEGTVGLAQFQCLRAMGFSFLIQEAYTESHGFWLPAVANAQNALAAGFAAVEFYHFPNQTQDPASQIAVTIKSLQAYNVSVSRLWIDIEGSWPASQSRNQQFLSSAVAAVQSFQVAAGIYVGRDWATYFGANYTAYADLPLWTALYDNIPSQRFYYENPWGGWAYPVIKQFSADGSSSQLAPSHCNVTIDWNFFLNSEQAHYPVKPIG